MATQEDRERESRESDESKFHETRADESEEREQLGEQLADEPLEPDAES